MTPFPGTPLYERLERAGRILEPGAGEKCTLFDVIYQPAQLSIDPLRQGLPDLATKVYSKEFTAFRRRQFFKQKLARERGRMELEWATN
ncbi:MAG: hypothetical protein RIQ93_1334 [Verrucomicrobiota bacterium]|jgi:hypothetical protein